MIHHLTYCPPSPMFAAQLTFRPQIAVFTGVVGLTIANVTLLNSPNHNLEASRMFLPLP